MKVTVKDWSFLLVVSIDAGIPCLVFNATEHGIFSGRWEIDLTVKELQKVEVGPEFELGLFGMNCWTKGQETVQAKGQGTVEAKRPKGC
jgi:hypothetical protein